MSTSSPSTSVRTIGLKKSWYSAAAQHSEVFSSPGSTILTRAETSPHSMRQSRPMASRIRLHRDCAQLPYAFVFVRYIHINVRLYTGEEFAEEAVAGGGGSGRRLLKTPQPFFLSFFCQGIAEGYEMWGGTRAEGCFLRVLYSVQ